MWTESEVVNEWIAIGFERGQLACVRRYLARLIRLRLADPVPPKLLRAINAQPNIAILNDWFDAASTATTLDEFVAVLRR